MLGFAGFFRLNHGPFAMQFSSDPTSVASMVFAPVFFTVKLITVAGRLESSVLRGMNGHIV